MITLNRTRVKMLAATVGAGAVLVMAGITAVTGTSLAQEDDAPRPPGPVTTSEITTGETITETVLPEAPETSAATPPITTTPTPIPTGEA
ncbi:hypothetical protein MELE44368_13260 [Mycolicibacterium elephantis DSM 44368]|uniref:Uncharacterized protein n=1 Tax=Mycolicibacterium elephantis DSM 44368 TaxID=1335622 RepID=A0A439DY16_9MYCO|nr:hypothetical protein MELE44368_13260 [Mycolicibacterium elephantis DSM 44368]